MCISSLRTRTCYNMDCKRAHVKGTKRLRPTSHIPRLLDMRFNQQNHDRIQSVQSHHQNQAQNGQYHEGRRQEHDQRHTVMSQSNNNHQQYNHHGPRQQEHDQRWLKIDRAPLWGPSWLRTQQLKIIKCTPTYKH